MIIECAERAARDFLFRLAVCGAKPWLRCAGGGCQCSWGFTIRVHGAGARGTEEKVY